MSESEFASLFLFLKLSRIPGRVVARTPCLFYSFLLLSQEGILGVASGREEAFFAALALLSQVIPAPLEDAGDDSDDDEDDDDVLMEEAEGAGEAALIKASIGLLNDRDFVGNLIGLVERVGGKEKVKGPLPESTAQVFRIFKFAKLHFSSPDCASPLLRVSPVVDALTHCHAQLRSPLHSCLQALTISSTPS